MGDISKNYQTWNNFVTIRDENRFFTSIIQSSAVNLSECLVEE